MSDSNPYDWPFPQRKDLMTLSTIKSQDVGFNKIKPKNPYDSSLRVEDIAGAQPCIKAYRYTNKEDFSNRKDDIAGSAPKPLTKYYPNKQVQAIQSIFPQDTTLYNSDIDGTQPQINKFITTRAPSNPLEPVYKVSYTEKRLGTPPKFIRDQMYCADIEGTVPMPNYQKLRKNVMVYDEIEGSKPKIRFQPRHQKDIMNVKDINDYLVFQSKRLTNPLHPVYDVPNEEGQLIDLMKIQIGEIEGSKSRQLHPLSVNKMTSQILNTQDIAGAQHGTHSQQFLRTQQRTNYREINKVEDIPGAQVSSLKKGMQTLRRTNPIVPSYQIPGHTEIYSVFQNSASNNIGHTASQSNLGARASNAQKLDQFLQK